MNAEHIEALRERWGLLHRLCEEYALVNDDAQVAKYRREQRALEAALAAMSAEGGDKPVAFLFDTPEGRVYMHHSDVEPCDMEAPNATPLYTRPAAAATGDGARLDFMAHHGLSLRQNNPDYFPGASWYLVAPYSTGLKCVDDCERFPEARDAIDAAMKAAQQEPQ